MSHAPSGPASLEPLRIGDHPALDLLNTTVMENEVLVDRLQSDGDVLRWLDAMGFDPPRTAPAPKASLLSTARNTRELLRSTLEATKARHRVDWQPWNALLAKARSHAKVTVRSGRPEKTRVWEQHTPEQVLGPLLESAVDLLLTGDFHLIRRCENPACILWFRDRTRSHRRRWCSMGTCGNRHKVAAFRERQKA